jgi:hypothetical protein
MESRAMQIGAPAAPGNNETVTLLDTAVLFNGAGLPLMGIRRVRLAFPGLDEDSAVSGLNGYVSPDKGTNWYIDTFEADATPGGLPVQVTAQDSEGFMWYDIAVVHAKDVKFTFTAGATGPSVWSPIIILDPDSNPTS